jgi:hypothetical protein
MPSGARRSTSTSGSPVLFPQAHPIFSPNPTLGVTVWDLFYVGLTIVVFAVLFLILKGIESFER